MAIVTGNTFNTFNEPKKNNNLKHFNIIENYKFKSKEISQDMKNILNNCKGYEGVSFEEIEVDSSNFSDYHFDIMAPKLVVMYDNENFKYKLMNENKQVFIVNDNKIIDIVFGSDKRNVSKISYGYIPKSSEYIFFSIELLSEVFFNIKNCSMRELIRKFIKENADIHDENEYALNYHLFNIYNNFLSIINKHHYWKYLFLEQKAYDVAKKMNISSYWDSEILNSKFNDIKTELIPLLKELDISVDALGNEEKLLEIFSSSNNFPSLNASIQQKLNNTKSARLIELADALKLVNILRHTNHLPNITTHNENGNISCPLSLTYNFCKDKVLYKGSFRDLYFKMFAELSYNKDFIRYASIENSKVIKSLLVNTDLNLTNSDLEKYTFLVSIYVRAIIQNIKEDNDIINYFQTSWKTIISLDELSKIKDIYTSKIPKLADFINLYNKEKFISQIPDLIWHSNLTPLGINIYNKMRLIMKNTIYNMYKLCSDFNNKNKAKMNIVYLEESSIYLAADVEAENALVDNLTRVMTDTFNEFCKSKVIVECQIEKIN